MDELEDMMFMEAVRLSLAAEEERKKKEAKSLRKDAKKKEQAEKKAAKKAAKDPYGGSVSGASGSSLSLGLGRKRGNSGASNLRMEATVQGASQASKGDDRTDAFPPQGSEGSGESSGKGKAVDRGATDSSGEGGSTSAIPIRSGGSHLRQMSNASSLGSSLVDSAPGSFSGGGFLNADGTRQTRGESGDGEEASEPMFNFRSLAELVGVNIDEGTAIPEEGSAQKDQPEAEEAAQETQTRPLSQVKEEEDELAPGHDETKETPKNSEKEAEKLQPERHLDTEETLVATHGSADRGTDGKTPEPTVLVGDAAAEAN